MGQVITKTSGNIPEESERKQSCVLWEQQKSGEVWVSTPSEVTHLQSISKISSFSFGPRPWHLEIRHRVKKKSTIDLFGFETLELTNRRLKLWKQTVNLSPIMTIVTSITSIYIITIITTITNITITTTPTTTTTTTIIILRREPRERR